MKSLREAPIASDFNIFKVYENISEDDLDEVIRETVGQTKAGSAVVDFSDKKQAELYDHTKAVELKAFDKEQWLSQSNIANLREDAIDSYLQKEFPLPTLPESKR